MLKPTFKAKVKTWYHSSKKRGFTPPNLLDFLSDEPLSYDWSWRLWWKPFSFVCFLHGLATFIQLPAKAVIQDPEALSRISQLEAKVTSEAFDAFWINTMPDWLQVIRTTLAFLGVIAIAWYAVWLAGQSDSRGAFPWKNLVLPMVLIVLLSTGDFMARAARSARDVMNKTGEEVLVLVGSQSKIEQAQALRSYPIISSSQTKQCEGQPPGELQAACFEAAGQALGQLVQLDEDRFGNQPWLAAQKKIVESYSLAGLVLTGGASASTSLSPGSALVSTVEEGLMIILDAFGEGFQFIIECAYILTALLLPISLLLGLSPLQAQGPIAWVVSMVGIGTIKFMNNVVIAIGADLLINSEGLLYILFGLVSAILAPLIAIGLAGGGGVVIIIGILQFSSYSSNSKQGN